MHLSCANCKRKVDIQTSGIHVKKGFSRIESNVNKSFSVFVRELALLAALQERVFGRGMFVCIQLEDRI